MTERVFEDGTGLAGATFPFPLADPVPEPVMVARPCGCTSMITEPGGWPVQVSWCVADDPGYEPPGRPAPAEPPGEDPR